MDHRAHPAPNPSPKNLVICCDGRQRDLGEHLQRPEAPSLPSEEKQDAAAADGALRSQDRPAAATRKHPPRALTVH